MIITRSPLRITLGGGGTDLPSYYRDHEGFLIAAAIDKYVYITLHETFDRKLVLKYSQMERPEKVDDIRHPIIREAFGMLGMDAPQVEISSMADIPAGTGLGSSGSFTTALLKALHVYRNDLVHPEQLAEEACHLEMERLGEPVGKQDQYIAAFGGITCFRFRKDGKVEAWPLNLNEDTRRDLEENLLVFYTGMSRSASHILKDQDEKTRASAQSMLDNLHYVKDLGLRSKDALERGDLAKFGALMHEHWEHKKKRSGGMSSPEIDEYYALGMKNGALGGKLVGAGGGGFLMFYAEEKSRLRRAMKEKGLQEIRLRLGKEGTKVFMS